MRRTSTGPILIGVALLILIALFSYFAYQLNKQDKKLTTIQATVISDGDKISSVVNFINSSIANAQQPKTTTK
jgi:hypothetical protein